MQQLNAVADTHIQANVDWPPFCWQFTKDILMSRRVALLVMTPTLSPSLFSLAICLIRITDVRCDALNSFLHARTELKRKWKSWYGVGEPPFFGGVVQFSISFDLFVAIFPSVSCWWSLCLILTCWFRFQFISSRAERGANGYVDVTPKRMTTSECVGRNWWSNLPPLPFSPPLFSSSVLYSLFHRFFFIWIFRWWQGMTSFLFPFRSLLVVRDLTDDAPVCRDSLSPLDTPPRVVHDRH